MNSNTQPTRKRTQALIRGATTTLLIALIAANVYVAWRTNQKVEQYQVAKKVDAYSLDGADAGFASNTVFSADDFVTLLDARLPSDRLGEMFTAVRNRIAELRRQNRLDEAAEMQADLYGITTKPQGPYANDGQRQLHFVGLNQGVCREDLVESIEGEPLGNAVVRLTYQHAPIVLCLSAYNPVKWQVEIESGVQLERVIVAGIFPQEVVGIPTQVPIEGHLSGDDEHYRFHAYDACNQLNNVAARLKTLTGLQTTTYQGAYRYESPFVIGPQNRQWADQMIAKTLEPLYREATKSQRDRLVKQLVQSTFPELHVTPPDDHGKVQASLADFTVFGPYIDTMWPLERMASRFAFVEHVPEFIVWQDGLHTIDRQNGAVLPFRATNLDGLGSNAWLAYDSKRKRLLLWGNNLYAVNLSTREGSLVREGNPGIHGFCYSPAEDRLITVGPSRRFSKSIRALKSFDHRGVEQSSLELSPPISDCDGDRDIMMVPVGGKIALMPLPIQGDPNDGSGPSSLTFIIDPLTGHVDLVCRRKPR
jgi:hypothetical protein